MGSYCTDVFILRSDIIVFIFRNCTDVSVLRFCTDVFFYFVSFKRVNKELVVEGSF